MLSKNLARYRSENSFVTNIDHQNNYVETRALTMLQKVTVVVWVSHIIILMIQTKLFSDRQNRFFRVFKFYKNEKILVSLQTAGPWFHARILQRAISKANERERLHWSLAFLGGPRGRWWRNHRPRGASLRKGVRHRYLNPHEVGSGEEKVHVCKFRKVAARLLSSRSYF